MRLLDWVIGGTLWIVFDLLLPVLAVAALICSVISIFGLIRFTWMWRP